MGGWLHDYFIAVVLKKISPIYFGCSGGLSNPVVSYFYLFNFFSCSVAGQTLISCRANKSGSGGLQCHSAFLRPSCVHAWLLHLPQWASLICLRVTLACLTKCHFLSACPCVWFTEDLNAPGLQHPCWSGVCTVVRDRSCSGVCQVCDNVNMITRQQQQQNIFGRVLTQKSVNCFCFKCVLHVSLIW